MSNLKFVIHKHDATQLHFDLRLEVNGVMPSWAIPKGPTMDPTQKRLAMKTPDHPLSYRKFEGTIPEGKYGAGPVEIWDEGEYIPEIEIKKDPSRHPERSEGSIQRIQIKDKKEGEKIMEEGLKKGELKFFLKGKIVKGSFALVKTNMGSMENAWLLIKHKDEFVLENFDAKKI